MKLDYGWESPADFHRWGPYVSFGKSPATEMTVSWKSKFFALERWVEYGENPACDHRVEEEVAPTVLHHIVLSNLKPDTQYYYKISRSEDRVVEDPPVYTFRTAPSAGTREPFDFCVVGDVHASSGNATQLFQRIVDNAPATRLIVSCGDCVTHGGQDNAWNDFFYQFSPFTSQFVIVHATGNHDTDHPETYARFLHTFPQPYVDPRNGAYFAFSYGNARFIILDSTNAGQRAATQGVVSDEQLEWLEGELAAHGKKDEWVFLFMHHPMYSTGDTGSMAIYELAYRDLFDEAQVDAVFFGHDHQFEVFWSPKDAEWGGTHYCLVGNGGGDGSIKIRDEKTTPPPNYLWKGRTYIFTRDGILDGNRAGGVRNDDFIAASQVYGVIEQGFTHCHLDGDACTLRMVGMENQTYFDDIFRRTGQGKQYHPPKFVREY